MLARSPRWMPICVILALGACRARDPLPSDAALIVHEAKTLPPRTLAVRLIGAALGSRVIEAVRHEYTTDGGTPREVDLYSKPDWGWPRLNEICRTDVVTVEYNWFDYDHPSGKTPLKIVHVEAASRYKSFPMPAGEPGSPENEKAQMARCAGMKTATDAFRAPSAGDAQWLARIAREYTNKATPAPFAFTCSDFADATCGQARTVLLGLALNRATDVKRIDCPKGRTRDQVNYCYQLSFPYSGEVSVEWELTVAAGMRDGMAPVEIRSLNLEHQRKPIVMS